MIQLKYVIGVICPVCPEWPACFWYPPGSPSSLAAGCRCVTHWGTASFSGTDERSGDGSKPIGTIFGGINIHKATIFKVTILGFLGYHLVTFFCEFSEAFGFKAKSNLVWLTATWGNCQRHLSRPRPAISRWLQHNWFVSGRLGDPICGSLGLSNSRGRSNWPYLVILFWGIHSKICNLQVDFLWHCCCWLLVALVHNMNRQVDWVTCIASIECETLGDPRAKRWNFPCRWSWCVQTPLEI